MHVSRNAGTLVVAVLSALSGSSATSQEIPPKNARWHEIEIGEVHIVVAGRTAAAAKVAAEIDAARQAAGGSLDADAEPVRSSPRRTTIVVVEKAEELAFYATGLEIGPDAGALTVRDRLGRVIVTSRETWESARTHIVGLVVDDILAAQTPESGSTTGGLRDETIERALGAAHSTIDASSRLGEPGPVNHDDLLVALGLTYARISVWNTVAAELHFSTVLDENPSHAGAIAGVGVVRTIDRRPEDAIAYYEESLGIDPDSAFVRTLAGWGQIDAYRKLVGSRRGWDPRTPEPMLAARRHCARALELDPESARAAQCFGVSHLYELEPTERAAMSLESAWTRLSWDTDLGLDVALMRGRTGELDQAWELLRILGDRADGETVAVIGRTALLEETIQRAARLLREERIAEGRALLEQAHRETDDEQIAMALANLDVLARRQNDDRLAEAHNRAKAELDAGRYDEARRLVEEILSSDPDDDIRASTERIRTRLDELDP